MGNPNPFYRFKQGWNAGFYPDNQIVSDLINEMYGAFTLAYPSWIMPGTTTLGQLLNSVNFLVNQFNGEPLYGDFVVNLQLVPAGLDYNFTLTVRNNSLYVIDNSQEISITGVASNPGRVIASSLLNAFVPGNYIGTFDPTIVNEELKVKEALNVVNINGSAIFPITYSYDATTGVATSGLARAKDWKLDNGVINRFPIPVQPFQNQRTFELAQLNGDDNYIITVMERIIQASLANADYTTSVLEAYNSFTLPDGWISAVNYPSFTTYERVQFNFVDAGRRSFILVGRKDTTWLWQRFVNDSGNLYNFMTGYVEADALPYEVMQAGRWVYPNVTYDFEFVEFTSGCYVSPEFYAMPAKPGDQLQFNVVDGNLEGITNVNVGLFTESGQFIQKIGDATKLATENCECVDCAFLMELNFSPEAFQNYLDNLNSILTANPEANIFSFKYVYTIDGVTQGDPALAWPFTEGFELTTANIFNYTNFGGFSLELVNGLYRFSFPVLNAVCGSDYQFKQYFTTAVNDEYAPYQIVWDSDIYECPTPEPLYELVQHQASVTIPSLQGCYRMGLYEVIESGDPPTTCDVVFNYSVINNSYIDFEDLINDVLSSAFPYITFTFTGGPAYTYNFSEGTSLTAIAAWCSSNIPGMVCNVSESDSMMYWTWTQTLECSPTGYTFSCYQSDSTGVFIDAIFETQPAYCDCDLVNNSCNQYYWNSGTTSEGVPIFQDICDNPNNFLSVRVTDLAETTIYFEWITPTTAWESNCWYSQDLIIQWLNSIPGFRMSTYPQGESIQEWFAEYNGASPCGIDTKVEILLVDSNGDPVTTSIFELVSSLPGDTGCQCSLLCEQTFAYTINNAWQWLFNLQSDGIELYTIGISYDNSQPEYLYEGHTFPISNSTTPNLEIQTLIQLNSVPGLVVVHDTEADTLAFTWTINVPCEVNHSMTLIGHQNEYANPIEVFSTEYSNCQCPIVPGTGELYAALYSLSNIINIDKSDCFSTILEFWSDNNTMAEGFEYYENWKQRVRIGLNGGGEKPVIEESLYRQSNGVHRRPQNKQDLSLDLHTDFFDLDTQLAMTDATRHPYLVWEGKPIFVKGDIEVATTQDFTTQSSFETLSQMKFQALKQGFQPRNSSCLNC
jgi:hypothetical protein